ncbi:MAG: hypothetical protein GC160_04340 [Acidobacteria bacterium]|nr:hypothetical protein [Acidobacteriota bacterium]
MTERQKRRYALLQTNYTDLMNVAGRSDFIHIEAIEVEPPWPPDRYIVTYTCVGISGVNAAREPVTSSLHRCELYLSQDYPKKVPSLLWLTPIWHPNIMHREPRHVCTNEVQNYYPGKSLGELIEWLGELVQYKRYHARHEPPFPIDTEVAQWVLDVAEPKGWISTQKPVDSRPLLRGLGIVQGSPPPAPAPVGIKWGKPGGPKPGGIKWGRASEQGVGQGS